MEVEGTPEVHHAPRQASFLHNTTAYFIFDYPRNTTVASPTVDSSFKSPPTITEQNGNQTPSSCQQTSTLPTPPWNIQTGYKIFVNLY
jgi:hypothetical protein